jgi:DNA polymerase
MSELSEVAERIRACTLCNLCQGRTHAVPGEGPEDALIMLIGEGPGAQEDLQGRPFVGASGRFMAETLAQAGIDRQDVFITNVVKCRPPGNRDPQPDEMDTCTQVYLDLQIALIQPKIIVTLGRFSMGHFLPGASISRIHGQPHRVGDVIVYPMLHPAAALRRPEWKTAFVADAQRIPDLLASAGHEPTTIPAPPTVITQPAPLPATPVTPPAALPGDEPQQLSLF